MAYNHHNEDHFNESETKLVQRLNEDTSRFMPCVIDAPITVHYYHGNLKLGTHAQYQTPRLGELKWFDGQSWEVSVLRPALQTTESTSIVWVCDMRKRGRNE